MRKEWILLVVLFAALPPRLFADQGKLKELVIRADLTVLRSEQKDLAKQAIKIADACIQRYPKDAACHYYRGQARGLYHGETFFGYPQRVRSMLADWQKVMELDPSFDYGGPYRMFAETYTALPKRFGPKDLRQNLNKAVQYLEKAIKISNYPTNFLDLAEAHLKSGRFEEAQKALNKAEEALPQWRDYPYYGSWEATLSELDKKLRK